jgi:hypothetical protein
VLQGWLGQEVEVSSHGGDGVDPVVAVSVRGRLRGAEDIGGAGGAAAGESFLFVIEGAAGEQVGSFMLYERCFGGARWLNEKQDVMEIRSGVVRVLVGPGEDL